MIEMLQRGFINAPSTLQADHPMHGQRVIYDPTDKSEVITVYFAEGAIISARVLRSSVSPGWHDGGRHDADTL